MDMMTAIDLIEQLAVPDFINDVGILKKMSHYPAGEQQLEV